MKSVKLLNICADFIKNIPDNLNYITPSELRKILKDSPQSIFILDVRSLNGQHHQKKITP